MKIYKINDTATTPQYQTEGSAGFDLHVALGEGDKVKMWNTHNKKLEIPVRNVRGEIQVQVPTGFRALIPTKLIFDIPNGHYVEIVPRSSVGIKQGMAMPNSVGVIDSDYVEEVYLAVYNVSDTPATINHGDRISQGILKKYERASLGELKKAPTQKTSRDGGIGSTGTGTTDAEPDADGFVEIN
jgi:dUTP pyrophosphatase